MAMRMIYRFDLELPLRPVPDISDNTPMSDVSDKPLMPDISGITLRGQPEAVMIFAIRRPEDIAAAIKQARQRRNLTQAQLASRLNVNREWVSRLEGGEGGITLKLLLPALAELGLTLTLAEEAQIGPAAGGNKPFSIDEIVDE